MKIASQALLTIAIAVGLSTALTGKGLTSRITISGGSLTSPLEISDPTIVRQFEIWTGPGTQGCVEGQEHCVEGTDGFIVDWPAGPVLDRPSGLQRYEISFFVEDERVTGRSRPEALGYVVAYEFDPARSQGFVYLPGRGDQWYTLNVRSIYRQLEGRWFHATRAWQDVVGPLISREVVPLSLSRSWSNATSYAAREITMPTCGGAARC